MMHIIIDVASRVLYYKLGDVMYMRSYRGACVHAGLGYDI
jgi:hypothetical protein